MNTLIKELDQTRMKEWFEHLHSAPELSMQEENTAAYIAAILQDLGYEVHTGVGRYGIVGSLTVGESKNAIGLRADFDALPIQETNTLPTNPAFQVSPIFAVMTPIRPCCWVPQNTWLKKETSMAPCG